MLSWCGEITKTKCCAEIVVGNFEACEYFENYQGRKHFSFLFAHPESFLNKEGRVLLRSDVYRKNVIAVVVIDEARCVEMW